MPNLVHQLSATTSEGSAPRWQSAPSRPPPSAKGPHRNPDRAARLAFLRPVHSEDLPAWPGTATHPDIGSMPCGTILDFRTAEQRLQSHADLWLTPLTGVDPKALNHAWSDVLDQADRVLLAWVEEAAAASEDSPLQNILAMMGAACRSAVRGELGWRQQPWVTARRSP